MYPKRLQHRVQRIVIGVGLDKHRAIELSTKTKRFDALTDLPSLYI
jgi:hypothetical protein